jgi:hypothetical protein
VSWAVVSTFTPLIPRKSNILPVPRKDKCNQVVEDELWVDRHRPTHFTDLTGNERVAREVMTWLKKWDWCVFGRRKSRKHNHPGRLDENAYPEDEYHRPPEKVLNISHAQSQYSYFSPLAFAFIRCSGPRKDHSRACHRPTSWVRGLGDQCQVRKIFFP